MNKTNISEIFIATFFFPGCAQFGKQLGATFRMLPVAYGITTVDEIDPETLGDGVRYQSMQGGATTAEAEALRRKYLALRKKGTNHHDAIIICRRRLMGLNSQ